MNKLSNLNITVYVTGSVACYKTLSLIRLLKKRNANVKVVMTRAAQQFINPITFKAISGNPVLDQKTWRSDSYRIPHVDLAKWTDLALVMPATANVMAKMANGIADDVVSTCLLATSAPKVVVPAMNNLMWHNSATQRNVRLLDSDPGIKRLGPAFGQLTENTTGKGRMLEPYQVVQHLEHCGKPSQPLSGMRILVTAGATQEIIDPVRYITNGSTGKMGYAIAAKARDMGADVTLISGHAQVPVPQNVKLIRVRTTEDMLRAVLKRFPKSQVLIMSAALADFKPITSADQKIKKDSPNSSGSLNLKLVRTPDVLRNVARIKKSNQLTIGFAAETQNLIQNASQKLKSKKLDLIVANDVTNSSIGFGSNNNQVTFINAKGRHTKTSIEPKSVIAERLLKIVAKLKDDRS